MQGGSFHRQSGSISNRGGSKGHSRRRSLKGSFAYQITNEVYIAERWGSNLSAVTCRLGCLGQLHAREKNDRRCAYDPPSRVTQHGVVVACSVVKHIQGSVRLVGGGQAACTVSAQTFPWLHLEAWMSREHQAQRSAKITRSSPESNAHVQQPLCRISLGDSLVGDERERERAIYMLSRNRLAWT